MAALNANRRFAVAAFAPGLLNVALLSPRASPARFARPGAVARAGARSRGAAPGHRAVAGAATHRLRRPAVVRARRRRAPRARAHRPAHVRHGHLLHRPGRLPSLPVRARRRGAELLLVGDAPLRLPARHLRHGAVDRGAAVAVDAGGEGREGELAKTWAHGLSPRDVRRDPRERGARGDAASRSSPRSSSAARSTRLGATRRRARSSWQGGAMWTVAAVRQTVPAFYALGDTRTPVLVSALDLRRSSCSRVMLRGPMGHAGISVAVAGSSAVQMVLLLVGLRRRMGSPAGWASRVRSLAHRPPRLVARRGGLGRRRARGGRAGRDRLLRRLPAVAWGLGAPELDEIPARSGVGWDAAGPHDEEHHDERDERRPRSKRPARRPRRAWSRPSSSPAPSTSEHPAPADASSRWPSRAARTWASPACSTR